MSFCRIYEKIVGKKKKNHKKPKPKPNKQITPGWTGEAGWVFCFSFESKIAEKLLQHKTTSKKNIYKQTTADLD